MNKQRMLLHICCAPCMIYPLKKLREDNFEVGGFFFNPNIYPASEYNLRKKTVHEYANRVNCNVYFSGNDVSELFFVGGEAAKPLRCRICWYMRLRKTAEHAKKINVYTFTTTLLVSPYQDKELIKLAGEKAARETGTNFYYEDFSVGYRDSVEISRREGLYRQKYCGCRLSLKEREIELASRKDQTAVL